MASLTPDQIEAFRDAIHPKLGYMVRAHERMERAGFGSADPLYQLVRRAEDALHHLWVELHYRSCDSGTGRPRDG